MEIPGAFSIPRARRTGDRDKMPPLHFHIKTSLGRVLILYIIKMREILIHNKWPRSWIYNHNKEIHFLPNRDL